VVLKNPAKKYEIIH